MAEWERELLGSEDAADKTDVETGPTSVTEAADATAAADVVEPAEQAAVAEATEKAAGEVTES
jgi:small subunit ribosomal protein S2